MFIELVDQLRCVRSHADICLVASVTTMEGRHISDGLLGCPVCNAEYPIRDGVAFFTAEDGRVEPVAQLASADEAMRLAAFLRMTDGRGFVILEGSRAAEAHGLRALSDTHLVLVNPPLAMTMDPGMSTIISGDVLPIARGSARAVALDGEATPALAQSAASTLTPGGRLVAPAALAVPEGITELVRDELVWVGERGASPAETRPVRLVRR